MMPRRNVRREPEPSEDVTARTAKLSRLQKQILAAAYRRRHTATSAPDVQGNRCYFDVAYWELFADIFGWVPRYPSWREELASNRLTPGTAGSNHVFEPSGRTRLEIEASRKCMEGERAALYRAVRRLKRRALLEPGDGQPRLTEAGAEVARLFERHS